MEFYFHQLWSALFQPPLPANISTQEIAQDPNLDLILRMTSLFVSQHDVSSNSQKAQKNPLFERLNTSLSEGLSDALSPPRLVKALAQDSSQMDHPQSNLLIVTGNTNTSSPAPVVMGALFPGMPWATNPNDTEEEKKEWASKITTSHILFQLQPKFRLLRWTGSHVPLPADFIYLDDEATADGSNMQSLEEIAANNEISDKSYWIGPPERTKTGLHIDPDTRVAMLRTTAISNEGGDSGRYEDIGVQPNGDGDIGLEEESLFTVSQIAVFKAESGTHANVCSGETSTEKNDSRYGNQSHETKIEGEELAKRIQGFGST